MSTHGILTRLGMVPALALSWVDAAQAMDSYRFLHVQIDTLWVIFLFLLSIIFVPFILMAVLTWRYADRKPDSEEQQEIPTESEK